MTLRRRLIVSTLVIAGGVLAFQPVARWRIESRLSDIFGCPVSIGSSKISLSERTISIRDMVVRRDSTSDALRVPNAALKFDWNAALFRNLQVNTLLATDVQWTPTLPSSEQVPVAIVDPLGQLKNQDQRDLSSDLPNRIESIALPIKQTIQSALLKQNESHLSIASKLLSIEARLRDSSNSLGNLNPLRQGSIADSIRKDLSLLRQSIAEDALRTRDFERSLEEMKTNSGNQLKQQLEQLVQSLQGDVRQRAIQMASSAIARDWNSNRSIAYALLQSLTSLQSDETRILSDVATSRIANIPRPAIENLPVRSTRVEGAKVRGKMKLDASEGWTDVTLPFELHIQKLSSEVTLATNPTSISLSLFAPEESAPDGSTPALLHGTATYIPIPQSSSLQASIVLENHVSTDPKRVTRIRQSGTGWTATVVTQVEGGTVQGSVVGKTSPGATDGNGLIIQINPESIQSLEQNVGQRERARVSQLASELQTKGTQLLQEAHLRINSLASQLHDEYQRNRDSWESRIGVVVKELGQYEPATRTARRTLE
jgi:hypothetical protein